MPQIKNAHFPFDPASCIDTYCGTFNLSYTIEHSQDLIESARLNMIDALPAIKEAIEEKIKINIIG